MEYYALHLTDEEKAKRGAFGIKQREMHDYNLKGYDIFYTINEFDGPRRKENLTKINAVYIDIDNGTKDEQRKRISKFPILPSRVVETKNGHHVYWMINEMSGEISSQIRRCEAINKALIKIFDADRAASDVTRLLRVPDTFHLKEPNDSYRVVEWTLPRASYDVSEFDEIVDEMEEYAEVIEIVKKPTPDPIFHPALSNESDIFEHCSNLPIEYAFSKLSNHSSLGGETFEVESRVGYNGNRQIMVNGKKVNAWVDQENKIGSSTGGGPTIVQWVGWYVNQNKTEIARILRDCFSDELPETKNPLEDALMEAIRCTVNSVVTCQ